MLGPQTIPNSPAGGSDASGAVVNYNGLGLLNSIDVVFTQDKSLWTRCAVVETQDNPSLSEGGVDKLDVRSAASIDKNGRQAGDAGYNAAEGDLISTTGMGWFPGYVIDLETGERLNVVYGEDSWLAGDNGRDMMFNPTSTFTEGLGSLVAGGKHYLYIFRNNDLVLTPPILANNPNPTKYYDEGKSIYDRLTGSN